MAEKKLRAIGIDDDDIYDMYGRLTAVFTGVAAPDAKKGLSYKDLRVITQRMREQKLTVATYVSSYQDSGYSALEGQSALPSLTAMATVFAKYHDGEEAGDISADQMFKFFEDAGKALSSTVQWGSKQQSGSFCVIDEVDEPPPP